MIALTNQITSKVLIMQTFYSQIMYLYYLLGWRLNNAYARKLEQGKDEKTLAEELQVKDLAYSSPTYIPV